MRGPRLVVVMWLVAIGLIVWGHREAGGTFPPAYGFTGAATMYSALALLAAFPATEKLAGALAVGWTVNLWRQVRPNPAAAPTKAKRTTTKKKAVV